MKSPDIALQTWTIRRELKLGKYANEILQRINSYGLKYFEIGGTGGLAAKPFRELSKKHGFRVMGLHEAPLTSSNLDTLLDDIKKRCDIFNARFVTVGWDTNKKHDEEAYSTYADCCSQAGPILGRAGITLSYHCYDFDLQTLGEASGEKSGLDILLEQTSKEDLSFQLDTYFIWKAICQLKVVLDKCGQRCKLIHLDDIDKNGVHAPLGEGTIPWQETIKTILLMCPIEWFIIEHETQQALEWIYRSYRYWIEQLTPLVERPL